LPDATLQEGLLSKPICKAMFLCLDNDVRIITYNRYFLDCAKSLWKPPQFKYRWINYRRKVSRILTAV